MWPCFVVCGSEEGFRDRFCKCDSCCSCIDYAMLLVRGVSKVFGRCGYSTQPQNFFMLYSEQFGQMGTRGMCNVVRVGKVVQVSNVPMPNAITERCAAGISGSQFPASFRNISPKI